jgi:hypothetical protein
MSEDLEKLQEENGGYWGEHPKYPSEDWIADVVNTDTRRSYWEWVESKIANEGVENCPPTS